jgi:hypothetical protein
LRTFFAVNAVRRIRRRLQVIGAPEQAPHSTDR